jgi:cell division protein FtsQ
MNRLQSRNSNNVLVRISRKLIRILLVLGIPSILFLSTFYIKKLEVVGSRQYTPEQITGELIKSKLDSNSLYLYLKHRYFVELKLPFVEKIDVTLKDTHTITVYVYEKMVAGCVEFMGEYMYFDKDGIVVESTSKKLADIPVIKGLKFDKIMLSEKLEVQKDELYDVIINLTQLIRKFELDVDQITFSSDYEVTLDSGDIRIMLGKKSTYDEALSELKNILAEAKGMKITLDMRNYVKGTHNIIGKQKNTTE